MFDIPKKRNKRKRNLDLNVHIRRKDISKALMSWQMTPLMKAGENKTKDINLVSDNS